MEEFMDLYRYKLYERTWILVNDLNEVFKEIELFIDKKLKPFLKESELDKLIFESIELCFDGEKFEWRVHLEDDIMLDKAEKFNLAFNNITKYIDEDKEFLKSLESDYGISMFPKVLYEKAFMVLTEVVSEYVRSDKLQSKLEIANIITIDNNDENNIVY